MITKESTKISYQWINRKEIRARYSLKGDAAEDLAFSFCCPACTLVQEEKELIYQTTGVAPAAPAQFAQPVAYVAPQQMQMPVQMQPVHMQAQPAQ